MPIIKISSSNNTAQEVAEIWNKITNKQYTHTYKETKSFSNWNAQLLTTTPVYTIQKNKLIRFNLRVPTRSYEVNWWGLYIQINAKVNWNWYNLGNCGYDGSSMSYGALDISTYTENKIYDFIWNLWLNSDESYTLQFEITCRAFTGNVRVNGSHDINKTASNLWSRWPLQSWASNQNYTSIIIEEVERY